MNATQKLYDKIKDYIASKRIQSKVDLELINENDLEIICLRSTKKEGGQTYMPIHAYIDLGGVIFIVDIAINVMLVVSLVYNLIIKGKHPYDYNKTFEVISKCLRDTAGLTREASKRELIELYKGHHVPLIDLDAYIVGITPILDDKLIDYFIEDTLYIKPVHQMDNKLHAIISQRSMLKVEDYKFFAMQKENVAILLW